MVKRNLRLATVAMGASLLSACGSGGGGGMASTPPPPSGPTSNTSLTNLHASETFNGRAAYIRYSVTGTGGNATATQRGSTAATNAGAQVRYDAGTQSYTLIGTDLAQTSFGSSDRVAANSTATITNYQKVNGNKQENLALFNAGAANTTLALTYASYGAYQSITTNASSLDVDTAFFTYGVQTAASDMPRSGTASYTTKIDGQFADPSGVYSLAGDSRFAADFGASTVSFLMQPIGTNVRTGDPRGLGLYQMTGTIAANSNQFTMNDVSDSGYRATMAGQFYGPQAAEVGGTFTFTGAGGFATGVMVGRKQ